MRFVKVNYHLNKKFFVEDVAYKQMVTKALQNFKDDFRVLSLEIDGLEEHNSFNIVMHIKKKQTTPYAVIIDKIQKELEMKSQLLINAKPTNIEINFEKE